MIITETLDTITLDSAPTNGVAYVHIVQQVSLTATTYVDGNVTNDSSDFTFTEDGYYIFTEITLSTTPGAGYYVTNGVVYNGGVEVTDLEDLLLVEGLTTEDYDWILYYFLKTYYLDLIRANFLKCMCNCNCSSQSEKVTADALTMGITVLETLIKYAQYMEALRILGQLSVCTGINNAGCGCNG